MKRPRFPGAATLLICLLLLSAWLVWTHSTPMLASGNTLQGSVEDPSHAPLGNIEVILLKRIDATTWEFVEAKTTQPSNGFFSFTALANGDYTLEYSDPSDVWLHQFHKNRSIKESADPIPLTGGATVDITATLRRAASIQGMVTSALPPNHIPLGGFPITLWRLAENAWIEHHTFTTLDDGSYRAAGLAAGEYRLQFGYATNPEYFDIYYPDAITLDGAQTIRLEAGEQRQAVDVRLEPKASIAGTIALPGALQAAGFRTCAVPNGAPVDATTGAPLSCASSALTDTDGNFNLPDLHAGDYLIYVDDTTYPQRVYDRWYPAVPGNGAPYLQVEVGKTFEIEPIALETAISVYGSATNAQGTPAPEVQVRLYETTRDSLRWDHVAWTDHAGRFDLQLRRPSTWTVGYFGPTGLFSPLYYANIETLVDADVVAVPTQTVSLNAGSVLVTGRTLQGRVENAQGNGLAGIEVHAFLPAEDENAHGRTAAEWLHTVQTNATGDYVLAGLGAEVIRLYYRDPAGVLQAHWYGTGGANASTIDEAAPVASSLGAAAQLAPIVMAGAASTQTANGGNWRITNAVTGTGIEGARITLYWLPGWRARVSPGDDEPYTCPSYASTHGSNPGPAHTLAPNAVMAFASAGILTPDANPLRSDANGSFGWALPPGCWQVHAEAEGYFAATSAVWGVGVDTAPNPNFSLTLERIGGEPSATPTPSPTHTPSVTPSATATPLTPTPTNTQSGQATSTAIATIVPPNATPAATSQSPETPTAGTPPPSGSVTPTFATPGTIPGAGTPIPSTSPEPSPSVEATMQPTVIPVTTTLNGTVFGDVNRNGRQDESERGVAGVRLEIVDMPAASSLQQPLWQRTATTDFSGRFVFAQVPFGEYELRVTPPIGMALLSPANLPLVVGNRDGLMPPLNLAIVLEPAPVLLPLIGK